ncbi:MAG: addiction module toxin RelE [Nanoarchaeota archaeon]|nr:addiction module toxin RelE [Nanoarchaeota archaeon]
MPYSYKTSKNLDRILEKLLRKDKSTYEQVMKKIEEVINSQNVEHYKNLKYNMKECKRVHIGSFVLVFKFNKPINLIEFDDFEHHDNIYAKK